MKNILILFIALITTSCIAQRGYTDYIKRDGLDIATKWGTAKNEAGEKKPALLLAIENNNAYAVEYSFRILLYYEGILREQGKIEGNCLEGLKSSIGKLNGIYFIPEKFTEEQLANSSFNFEIEEIEVEQVENCAEEE